MDSEVEDYLLATLTDVEAFKTPNAYYIRGKVNDDVYTISKDRYYIFTINNQYVITGAGPKELIDAVDSLVKKRKYVINDTTKLVSALTNTPCYE